MRWALARGTLLVPACTASLMSPTPTHDTSFLTLVTYFPPDNSFCLHKLLPPNPRSLSSRNLDFSPGSATYWWCDVDQLIQTYWTSGSLSIKKGITAVLKGLLGRLNEIMVEKKNKTKHSAEEWEVVWVEWSRLMKTRPDLWPLKLVLPCWGMCGSKSWE